MVGVLSRASVIAVVLAAASGVAGAADRVPTAFVGLQVLGLEPTQARSLEQAVEERLLRDQRFAVKVHKDPTLHERCKGKRGCYCYEARKLGVSHLIYANAGHIPPLYTFELVLLDVNACSVKGSLFVSERHNARSARRRVAELAGRLLTPKEKVSETAAKGSRNVDQVPAVVTVFTDKQMRQMGITRLPELFRLVPGFETVETNWGDIMLHHGMISTLLYMVDGVPLSNPKVNFGVFGQDFELKLNHVERVEFVRGPGSVLWGQNAFLGIVNLITRTPQTKGERARAHVRLGTLDSQELFAGVEGNRRWVSYWLSATWARRRSPITRVADSLWADLGVATPQWGNTGATDPHLDSYVDVVAKVRLLGRLELLVQYFSSDVQFEISPFGSLLLDHEPGFWKTSNLLYSASWQDSLPRGFGYRISASRYEHESWELFQVHPRSPSLPAGFSSLQGNEQQPEVNHLVEARLDHTWERGSVANRGLVGVSYLHQKMPDQYATLTTGQDEGVEALDIPSHSFNTVSAYIQDDFSLLNGLAMLSGGLRYDWHDPFQSALSWQAGILGGVPRLHGKLLHTMGFRPPAMNNLYSTTGVMGQPDLKPESSRALALELTGRPFGPLTLTIGGTVAWLFDLIKLEDLTPEEKQKYPDFTNRPVNREDALSIYSGYATVRLSWPRFDAFLSYVYKEHNTEDPVNALIPLAKHTGSAGASLRVLPNLNAFATLSAVGPRHVRAQTHAGLVTQTVRAYALLDLGLTVSDLLGMFDLTVKARNPARYAFHSPYRLDGRPSPLQERRLVSEILFTLSWARDLPWSEGKSK